MPQCRLGESTGENPSSEDAEVHRTALPALWQWAATPLCHVTPGHCPKSLFEPFRYWKASIESPQRDSGYWCRYFNLFCHFLWLWILDLQCWLCCKVADGGFAISSLVLRKEKEQKVEQKSGSYLDSFLILHLWHRYAQRLDLLKPVIIFILLTTSL